jgi:hypothetical protein
MEILTKDIFEIVNAEVNTINEKIKGLNFLEILKNNLVPKILPLINKFQFTDDQIINFDKEIHENSRIIKISMNYYIKSLSISKKKTEYDSLFISFNDISTFDIYIDNAKFNSLLLYKNTGITLPKDTVTNSSIKKNVFLLEINNKTTNELLTK